MAFIVKERDQVSRANAQTPNFFSPFCLILSVSCGDSERQLQSSPRVSADVATWPYLASQERGGRKERGRRRPKFHIRFLSKTDLESAAGFKAQRERRITISGGYQGRHFEAWSLCNTDRTHCYLSCSSSAQALWLKCVNVKKVQNLPCKLMSVPM